MPRLQGGGLRVGLLNNPLSGGNRHGLGPIRRVEAEHPWMPTRDVCTPLEVRAALGDFARAGVDVVAMNGGDGTVQAVLTVLLGERGPFARLPLLALLPAGTTALISCDVGLSGGRVDALRRLLAWARAGSGEATLVERPVLRMRSEDMPEPTFGMFFGAASILRGIEYAVTRVHPLGVRGQLGAGLTLLRMLGDLVRGRRDRLPAVSVATAIDGGPVEQRECLLVFVTTLGRLFLGLRPYWSAEPGGLHYTALGTRPQHLLRTLPFLLRGRPSRHGTPEHGYVSRNAEQIRLGVSGGFMLDGELLGKRHGPETVVLDNGGHVAFVRC
jgi:hypothetical protein